MGELILDIENFVCYSKFRFVVPLYKITLLKAPSGSGKTTIFNAISWVLFAKPEQAAQDKKTIITLTLPYLFIQRNSKPKQLTLQYNNNNTYYNEGAQQIIIALFGCYDFWLASSYVQQGHLNNFLSVRQEDKLAVLHALAYHQDDPKYYIDTIIRHSNEQYQQYQQHQQNCNLQQSHLALMYNTFAVDNTQVLLSTDELNNLKQQVIDLQIKLAELQQNQEQYRTNLHMLQYLQQQLQQANSIVLTCPTLINNDSGLSMVQLAQLSTIQLLPIVDAINTNYTINDYKQAVVAENDYKQYQQLKQQLLNYSINDFLALQNIVQEYKQLIKVPVPPALLPIIPYVQNVEPVFHYIAKYHYDDTFTIDMLQNKITEITNWLQVHANVHQQHTLACNEWRLSQNKQACPHCDKPLLLTNGKLQALQIDELKRIEEVYQNSCTLKNEYAKYEKELAYYTEQIKLQEMSKLHYQQAQSSFDMQILQWKNQQAQKLAQYENILAQNKERSQALENYKVNQKKIQQLLSQHSKLPILITNYDQLVHQIHNLKHVTEQQPINSNIIQQAMKQQELYQQYVQQQKQILTIIANVNYVYNHHDIVKWKNLYYSLLKYEQDYAYYQQEVIKQQNNINQIQEKISQISILVDNSELITQYTNQIITLQQKINDNEKIAQLVTQQQKIQDLYNNASKQYEIVTSLQQFEQEARLAEYDVLQDKVTSINNIMDKLNALMFNYKISTELKLFHTNKQQVEKPKVNLSVTCGPLIFDNPNALSGGEQYRVSLVLTLAINCCAGSNLLLLDECLSPVDEINQSLAIQALKERSNCTIIIIMHNGTNADFDNVITLK